MLTTKNETGTKIILKKSELWIPELMLSIKTWILLDKVYGESLKSVSTTFFRNISNKLIKVAIKPKANTPKMDIPDFLIKDAISKLIDKYVTIYKSKSEKQRILHRVPEKRKHILSHCIYRIELKMVRYS